MNSNSEQKYSKTTIVSVIICAFVFLVAIVSFFILPQKICVQIMSDPSHPETNTAVFLVAGVLVVGLASIMCMLSENAKKWIATESLLAIAIIGCLVYNYVILC
ncbi:MAG: hypothetical protein J6Q89_00085 [Clostridia bacterium]|nr:hypothetical protein [Clostridia bacterium]